MVDGHPAVVPKRYTTSEEVGGFLCGSFMLLLFHVLSLLRGLHLNTEINHATESDGRPGTQCNGV